MIGKEITKIHENFLRNDIDKFQLLKNSLKGEITMVVSSTEKK